jgi:hypothetical protein
LPDASLYFLGTLPEMTMAGINVTPSINNGNNRLTRIVLTGVAHLRSPRTMAKAAEIFNPVPAMTS